MKKLLFAIALLPAISLAAPTGQRVCRDDAKKIELTYGTYASGFDGATLTVDERSYSMDVNPGDGEGAITELFPVFCPVCEPMKGAKVGTAKWEIAKGEYDEAEAIKLSVEMPNLHLKDKILKCKVLDYKPGNEQN